MIKLKNLTALFLLGSLTANAKNADTTNGFYLGAFAGQSSYDVDNSSLQMDYINNLDDSDSATKIVAGYSFNSHWALEGGYADLGELNASTDPLTCLPVPEEPSCHTTQAIANYKVDGLFLNAKLAYPMTNQVAVYAKAGLFLWDGQLVRRSIVTGNTTLDVEPFYLSQENDGTDLFYGVGLSYQWKSLEISGEYELFQTDEADIDLLSLGVSYRF